MRKKSLSVKKIIHKKNLLKISDKKIINIYQRFKKNIVLLNDKSKFSAGISGGPDSMALAYFLKLYSLEKIIKIIKQLKIFKIFKIFKIKKLPIN